MADTKSSPNVDPAIFQFLQDKIDEEGKIRDVPESLKNSSQIMLKSSQELKEIIQTLEKQGQLKPKTTALFTSNKPRQSHPVHSLKNTQHTHC